MESTKLKAVRYQLEQLTLSPPDPEAARTLLLSFLDLIQNPLEKWSTELLSNKISEATHNVIHEFTAIGVSQADATQAVTALTTFLSAADDWIKCDWAHLNHLTSERSLRPGIKLNDALYHLAPYRRALLRLMALYAPLKLGQAFGVTQARKFLKSISIYFTGRKIKTCAPDSSDQQIIQRSLTEPYILLGMALTLSGSNDLEAKQCLLTALESEKLDIRLLPTLNLRARPYLARILRRLEENDAADEVEDILINYIRHRPFLYSPDTLKNAILLPNETSNVLFEKLASMTKKLHNPTAKDLRNILTRCYHCSASGATAKLLLCCVCKVAAYCQKRCQEENWTTHKHKCRELKTTKESKDSEAAAFDDWVTLMHCTYNQEHYSIRFRPFF